MYQLNLNQYVSEASNAHVLDLSLAELDVLVQEEQQAGAEFTLAQKEEDALWSRFEDLSLVASVTAVQAENTNSVSGAGYHMAGAAAYNATKGLGEMKVNAFEDTEEKFDLVMAGEDFKGVLTAIWNGLKKARDKVWRFLKRMWAKSVGRYARLRRSIVSTQNRADKLVTEGKSSEEKNVDVSAGLPSFYLSNKALNNPNDILGAYTTTVLATKFIYGDYLTMLKTKLPVVADAVSGVDVDDPAQASTSVGTALMAIVQSCHDRLPKQIGNPATGITVDTKHISSNVPTSSLSLYPLLGNSLLSFHRETGTNTANHVHDIRNAIFGIYDYTTKKSNYPSSVSIAVATPENARDFATQALEALDQILSVLDKSSIDKLSTSSDKINKALEKYKTQVSKSSEPAIVKGTATVTSILNATKKVDDWIAGIPNQMGTNFASQTAAINAYISKSLSTYK